MSDRAPDGTAFDLTGPKDAPVVSFIHGLGLCRQMWAAHLANIGPFRVLTYDLFGHGQSAPLPGDATLSIFARQLCDILDHLSIGRSHVIGFSIGGMINRRFALDHPDRLKSLVILNAPHDRGAEAQKQVEIRARSVRDQGPMATMDAALERWFTPEFLEGSQDLPNLVRHWRMSADPESYAQAAWVLAHGVRDLIAPSPPIAAPTLIMTCENDSGSTPEMSRKIAVEIAGARLRIVPALKHLGLLEHPPAFTNPIRDFLSDDA